MLHRCQGHRWLETFAYLGLEYFRYIRVFEFLQVKADARTLREALGFQLQLDNYNHEVIIATNVGIWERFCICIVDAGLEELGCQDEVYLVVNLPIRGMPGCCPRQLVGMRSVVKRESVSLCELSESPSSVVRLSNAKSSYCPCVCVRVYFIVPTALIDKSILLRSLRNDTIRLPSLVAKIVELFNLLVFMV